MTSGDREREFGTIAVPSLQRIRNFWIANEPLVVNTEYDDPKRPTEVRIELADGLGDAGTTRIDVQWTELDNYAFHYVDEAGVNWRFDRHPNSHSPENHFHPPPDASNGDAVSSCIQVTTVSLVTRAVYTMWRLIYETDDFDRLNSISNPP